MEKLNYPEELDIILQSALSELQQACDFAKVCDEVSEHIVGSKSEFQLNRFGISLHQRPGPNGFLGYAHRAAVVLMISALELHLKRFFWVRLLILKVVEVGGNLTEQEAHSIRHRAFNDFRGLKQLHQKLIPNASSELESMRSWLESINRLRHTICHNSGVVRNVDLRQGELEMETVWLTVKFLIQGVEVVPNTPWAANESLDIHLEVSSRSWPLGEVVDFSQSDVQDILISLGNFITLTKHELNAELHLLSAGPSV